MRLMWTELPGVLDLTGLGSQFEILPSVSAPSLPADRWEDGAIGVAADD